MNAHQREQAATEVWRGSELEAALPQLQAELRVRPRDAQQWCRLGELCDALACDAADQDKAGKYREQAVMVLTQAITLDPGLAKAHYALANVYRAQDMRLALLEFEAAAKCDPREYGEALLHAQKVVGDCTYRLRSLNFIALESAQEEPCAEIFEAEFYFEDHTIRSAVLHTCVSQDQRQHAKLWLFESENPDADTDEPLAQLAVSSNGNVFVSKGCPENYTALKRQIPRAMDDDPAPVGTLSETVVNRRVQASQASCALVRPRLGLPLWVPLGMLLVVFSGSLFAYLTLIAPAPLNIDKRAGERRESGKRTPIEEARDEIPVIVALAPERFRSTPVEPDVPLQAPLSAEPRAHAPAARLPRKTAVSRSNKPERTSAARPGRNERTVAAAAAPAGIGATEAAVVEMKSQPPSEPFESGVASQPPTAVRSVRSEPFPAATRSRNEQPRITDTWLSRMRTELDVCGKPGMWRNDLCRETVRWKHCHPNRWDTVRECVVERFASSSLSN